MEILTVAANLGVGAFLATLIFIYSWRTIRNLEQRARDDRKFMEDRLSKVLDDYNATTCENTKVLFELFTWLRAKNGSK